MSADPLVVRSVALPIAIDLGATVLFSITGAMVAIRRHYDPIGLFVLALACGLGGGLLRDGVFIQAGPPAAMRNGAYMVAVLVGCVMATLFFPHVERLSKPFLIIDALGTAAYGVVVAVFQTIFSGAPTTGGFTSSVKPPPPGTSLTVNVIPSVLKTFICGTAGEAGTSPAPQKQPARIG